MFGAEEDSGRAPPAGVAYAAEGIAAVAAEVGIAEPLVGTGVPQARQNRLSSGITDAHPAHFAIEISMAQRTEALNFTNLYTRRRNRREIMEFQAQGERAHRMKHFLVRLLIGSTLAASLLLAQGKGNGPNSANAVQRRVNFLTTLLSLTSSQQQQATTIFTNEAAAASSLHSSMKSAHTALNEAIQKNDTAGIDQASSTIGSLTAQLTSAQAKANAAFYQILMPDQQTKFTQLESQGRGFGAMGHGFGHGPAAPNN
jgi:Spy/CpxP family protein refolding chaperone